MVRDAVERPADARPTPAGLIEPERRDHLPELWVQGDGQACLDDVLMEIVS